MHSILKKTYHVHYTGCPYISICIIPKILYIRYFHKTTKDIVVYLVFPGFIRK